MDRDAYPDDMARFLRLSDEDVERIFRGVPPEGDEDLRDLAGFLADAAETLSRPPGGEVQARHMSLLAGAIRTPSAGPEVSSGPAAAASTIPQPTERRGLMRIPAVRWAAKVTFAAAGLIVLTAALAFAGVDLPGTAAETAFDKVGVELPNQAEEHVGGVPEELPDTASDTAKAVLDVIREWRSGAAEGSGCEFGAAVSAAARGESEPDTSRCEAGGGGGSAASAGSENASNADEGLDTADEASGGSIPEGVGSP
jgi:hypothetical protein